MLSLRRRRDLSWFVFGLACSVLGWLALSGCAGPQIYTQVGLVEQVLEPIPDRPGVFAFRACLRYEGSECKIYDVPTYDLKDDAFRASTVALDFVCNVGGARWKICPDKPGLCQYTYERAWFLAKKKLLIKFLPIEPWKFYVDAGVRCLNEDQNPFEEPE